MRMRALERLGHDVVGIDTIRPWIDASWLQRQIQRRLTKSSIQASINQSVIDEARRFQPHIVWAEKQEYLRRDTLDELKRIGCRLVHFTPDPYFSISWKRTTPMDAAIRAFDYLIYCKKYEREQYAATGKPIVYMPLGYCDSVHRPFPSRDRRWACDVGFLGGWEPRRERLLHAVSASGVNLKIWGYAWEFLKDGRWSPRRHLVLRQLAGRGRFRIHRDPLLADAIQGGEVYGDDYARALSGARIGVGFLRTTWPDQHTTRTFEIPACGSFLLADRSEEHLELFEEGKEAEFFSSEQELLSKLSFFLREEPARSRVAEAGYARCRSGRYSYLHRMGDVLDEIAKN